MEENKETKVVNFTTDNGEEIPFFVCLKAILYCTG